MKLQSRTRSHVNRCPTRYFQSIFVQFVATRHHPSSDVSSVGRSFNVDSPPRDDRLELDASDHQFSRTDHVLLVGMLRFLPFLVHGRIRSSTGSIRFRVPFFRRTCDLGYPTLGLDIPRLSRTKPQFLLSSGREETPRVRIPTSGGSRDCSTDGSDGGVDERMSVVDVSHRTGWESCARDLLQTKE